MTPLLIFIGIPPAVAVATGSQQIVASSFSGTLAQWKRKALDIKMGLVLMFGGVIGSLFGVQLFRILSYMGQIELLISLCYVCFLGIIGTIMLIEGINTLFKNAHHTPVRRRQRNWIKGLPYKVRFKESKLYISVIPPILIGFFVGTLSAIMGVGGGFIMLPAMIYLLGMPTAVVIGTSLFQITVITAITTILHAVENKTVDLMLASILLVGGVIGVQIGVRLGSKLKGEQLRILLAILVLSVSGKLAYDLIAKPKELFSIAPYTTMMH
jgi:uncharacterized membrane protein YfcA